MKTKFLLFYVLLSFKIVWGQVTVSSTNPVSGTYTACSNSNVTCSGTPYYGATIRMRVLSINGNQVSFSIASCSGNNFSTSGTAYIYRDSYCNATLLNSGSYTTGSSQKTLIYTFNNTGTFQIYGVTQTSGGAYYYTNPISVTVTAPIPSTPTLSSPSTNSCISFSNIPTPTFYWNSSANSSGYFIYINDITNGASNPVNLINGYSSNTSYSISSILTNWLPNRQYAWYVKGTNTSGESPASSIWIFNTKPTEAQATNTTNSTTVYPGGTVNIYANNTDNGVSYSWTGPNGFTSSIRNPILSNAQTNMNGTYTVTVTNNYGCSYTSSTVVNISQQPLLIVSFPNGGETFQQGQTVSINWSSIGLSGNIQVEITDVNNVALSSPFNPIGASGIGVPLLPNILNWTIPATLPNGQYKIKIYKLPTPTTYIDYSDATFTITGNSSNCITWSDGVPDSNFTPPFTTENNTAFQYLCSNNIINSNQLRSDIDNPIKREELAKVAFKGLYKPNGNTATTPADNYPVPFIDLQPSVANYIREAKVLSYLEYGDGISAFNRNFTHFRPKDNIQKQHALKLLLETFNIASAPLGSGNSWAAGNFMDVNGTTNFEMYYYLVKAYQLGIVTNATTFNPNADITRRELFVWLYRLLTNTSITIPTPTVNDFYTTGNITPANFGRMLSINDGNFNNYSKTSFNLDGKMPLTFTHTYNSLLTELPEGYIGVEPLGKGWTHNYNCYIKEVNGGLDGTNEIEPRVIIYWGDGTMNSFKKVGNNYVAETVGLYATLTKSADGNLYEYITKNKVKYQFSLQPNSFWTLTYIKDRNNNTTSLQWATNAGTVKPFLQWVETPGGRKLNFTYQSGTDLIWKVTETGLNREVVFTYTNNNANLSTFKDPDNNITTYLYEAITDVKKNHLLKQIQLPKGNIITNTYENRKLKTSVMQGQYQTEVTPTYNYNSGNANNFYQTIVKTTRDVGQTIANTSQMNTLGNITSLQNPTANVSVSYDATHLTKPLTISNTTTGLSGGMEYDSNGNVTKITKTAGSSNIEELFTYNSFNDVLNHTNGRGFNTTYNYNATGNLTSITDALGNQTTVIPNPDGTTQKITNPTGIYTDFSYNPYGNVTATSLMGTLTNQVGYDNASRAISSTNPNGVTTTMEYELNDMIKKVTVDPTGLNNFVQYQYDANDNLHKIINPMNGETVLDYNNQDQIQQYTFAGNNKQYTYNNDGTLKTFKDQNNVTFTNVYNADGTLQADGYATYTYNIDKTINAITRNGKILTFGYDALKRVNQVKYNDAIVNNNTNGVKYTYDANDNITSIEYPNGFKVGYEYDALDRLIRVYNFANNNNFAAYSYYNDGRLNQQTNGNGTKTIYSYDSYGRVNGISNQKSDGTIIYAQTYTMDNIGNHTQETTNEPFAPASGNINAATINYTHNNGNRMTVQDDKNYTYDGNGNQKTISGGTSITYNYDQRDNLLDCTSPSITCEYDALENRRQRLGGVGSNLFLLDIVGGNNVLMETNTSGTPTAYYIHGLGLIARLDANQANPSYYHYDYRGSTTAITNATQTVTHSYKYGPFGELWGSIDNGFTNVYRYVGKYGVQFEGNQLYFMRARYYNPYQGRFLGEDPIWNTNLYAYCDNNPINYVDYTGLKKNIPSSNDYWNEVDKRNSKRKYNNDIILEYENAIRLGRNVFKAKNGISKLKTDISNYDRQMKANENAVGAYNEQIKYYTDRKNSYRGNDKSVIKFFNDKINFYNNQKNSAESSRLYFLNLLNQCHIDIKNLVIAETTFTQEFIRTYSVSFNTFYSDHINEF